MLSVGKGKVSGAWPTHLQRHNQALQPEPAPSRRPLLPRQLGRRAPDLHTGPTLKESEAPPAVTTAAQGPQRNARHVATLGVQGPTFARLGGGLVLHHRFLPRKGCGE